MIVTCDHCGARYKLDESRVSGRGAKITCPRCKHVFVVYREQEAEIQAASGLAMMGLFATEEGLQPRWMGLSGDPITTGSPITLPEGASVVDV